jgi:hypothetical protein
VVALGVTEVEPLAIADVNPPGLIPMLVAPLALQLSVLLAPALMPDGVAAKELTVGIGGVAGLDGFEVPAQFVRPITAARTRKKRACFGRGRRDRLSSVFGRGRLARALGECRLEKFK